MKYIRIGFGKIIKKNIDYQGDSQGIGISCTK